MVISWLLAIIFGCLAAVFMVWAIVLCVKLRRLSNREEEKKAGDEEAPEPREPVAAVEREVSESGYSVKTEKSDKKVRLNVKEEPAGKRRVYFVVKAEGKPDVCVRLLPQKSLVAIFSHPKLSKTSLVDKGLYIEGSGTPLDLTLTAEEAGFSSFPEYNEGQEYVLELRRLREEENATPLAAAHDLDEVVVDVDAQLGLKSEPPEEVDMSPEKADDETDETELEEVEPAPLPPVVEERPAPRVEATQFSPVSPLMLEQEDDDEEEEEEEETEEEEPAPTGQEEEPTEEDYAGGHSNRVTPTWRAAAPLPKPRRVIATPSPVPSAYHRVELTSPDLRPLPWCPSEGNCYDINKEQHYTRYRHYCRIPNCTLASDPEHDRYFSHDYAVPVAVANPVAAPPVAVASTDPAPVFYQNHLG